MPETLQIHQNIVKKLDYFLKIKKIPNIIFHGESGSGKNTLVSNFIDSIYQNDRTLIKSFVMYVNCAHGKGIKFIREELKFFAKTHINLKEGELFKSIILLNADKLTIDAQSALRRCIELFSHTTRFFIIVENKYKLLKPILSRFCEIHVSQPIINNEVINLYKHNITQTYKFEKIKIDRQEWIKKTLKKKISSYNDVLTLSSKLYERGYSGLDLIKYLENCTNIDEKKKYQYLLCFNRIRKEFRNEKLLMLFMLNFILLRYDFDLENISFM